MKYRYDPKEMPSKIKENVDNDVLYYLSLEKHVWSDTALDVLLIIRASTDPLTEKVDEG